MRSKSKQSLVKLREKPQGSEHTPSASTIFTYVAQEFAAQLQNRRAPPKKASQCLRGRRRRWHIAEGRENRREGRGGKAPGGLIYLARLLGTSIGWMLPLLQRERGRSCCVRERRVSASVVSTTDYSDWGERLSECQQPASPHDSTRPRAGAVHAPSHTHPTPGPE